MARKYLPWAMGRMCSSLSPPSRWLTPAEHAAAEGSRPNLCQPGREQTPEQIQWDPNSQLRFHLFCCARLNCSFLSQTSVACNSMANTTFNSCAQGAKVFTAVYVLSLISIITTCCTLVLSSFSPQLTWVSGYWALLTLDPGLL